MTSRFNVIYSPEAKDDLRSIASYILFELKAPQAAQNVTTRIRNEIRSLEEMPERTRNTIRRQFMQRVPSSQNWKRFKGFLQLDIGFCQRSLTMNQRYVIFWL